MTNENYLIVSYFVVALVCLALSIATYILLRRSFAAIIATAPGGRLGNILRTLFLIGIILPAMAGFFSVSFRSCEKESYQSIIEDRSYLVAKNQEQLHASLSYIVIALLVWGALVATAFMTIKTKGE